MHRLSGLSSCSHSLSSQPPTVQLPIHGRVKQFQHMTLQIKGCRRSINAGWPSTAALRTIELGLGTFCLTPEIMGKLQQDPHLPRTSPDWPAPLHSL